MARKKKISIAAERDEASPSGSALIALATDLVSSYFAHNQVPAGDVSGVVRKIHASLAEIGYQGTATVELGGGGADYLKEVNRRFEKILSGDPVLG